MKALILMMIWISLHGLGVVKELSVKETKDEIVYELELSAKITQVGLISQDYRDTFYPIFTKRIIEYTSFKAPSVFISKTLSSSDDFDVRQIEVKLMPTSIVRKQETVTEDFYKGVYVVTINKKDANKVLTQATKLMNSDDIYFSEIPDKIHNHMISERFGNHRYTDVSIESKGVGFVYSKYNKLGVHCYDRYEGKGHGKIQYGEGCEYTYKWYDGRKTKEFCGLDDKLEYLHGFSEDEPSKVYPKECYY